MIRKLAIATAALLALGAAAAAETAPEHPKLKAEAVITGGIVRIGDLVDHAGIIASVPIFRAPDLGVTGTVSAEAVVEAVRPYALVGLDTGDVAEVTVTRASRAISAKTIEDVVAQALAAQYALGPVKDIVVHFERELRAIHVEPSAKGDPRVAYINYDSRSALRRHPGGRPAAAAGGGLLHPAGPAAATGVVIVLPPLGRGGGGSRDGEVAGGPRARAEAGRVLKEEAGGRSGRARPRQAAGPAPTRDGLEGDGIERREGDADVDSEGGRDHAVGKGEGEGGRGGGGLDVRGERTMQRRGWGAGPGPSVVASAPGLPAIRLRGGDGSMGGKGDRGVGCFGAMRNGAAGACVVVKWRRVMIIPARVVLGAPLAPPLCCCGAAGGSIKSIGERPRRRSGTIRPRGRASSRCRWRWRRRNRPPTIPIRCGATARAPSSRTSASLDRRHSHRAGQHQRGGQPDQEKGGEGDQEGKITSPFFSAGRRGGR